MIDNEPRVEWVDDDSVVSATTNIPTGPDTRAGEHGLLIVQYRYPRRALTDHGVAAGVPRWAARLRAALATRHTLRLTPIPGIDVTRWRRLVEKVALHDDGDAEHELNEMGFTLTLITLEPPTAPIVSYKQGDL